MKRSRLFAIALLALGVAYAQRSEGPQPPIVDPGGAGKPPSDAVVLFNGRDNSGWTTLDGAPSKCTVAGGVMLCRTGAGDVQTTAKFRDAQIHLEFMVQPGPGEKGWARGNSGVILLNRYEIQILDSYKSEMAAGGENCAGFTSFGPLVNACRPPGEWQSYDIVFHAPRCAPDGSVETPGSLTLLHNGVLVHDHVPVRGRNCVGEGPLVLQDHSRYVGRKIAISPGVEGPAPDTTTRFRNIWLRRLGQ